MANSKDEQQTQLPTHGAAVLPSVKVDSYNLEVEDEEGFLGDKANRDAFWEILDKWRKPLQDQDPLGDKPSEEIGKKKLAALLTDGEPEAAGIVQSAIEDFAQQLALVIRRFVRLKSWRDTECLVIGGGFSGSRIGELAVARAGLLLKADDINVDLELIRSDPDEAGLLGAAHLLPAWMLKGYEGILAVDVGGTNIRAGIVELNLKKATDLSKARVVQSELWRHADEEVKRDDAVEHLAGMLNDMLAWGRKNKIPLAPVIGIGCPGVIHEDGSIARGCAEPAGQLGEQPVQPSPLHRRGRATRRRPRNAGGDAQRRRCAGLERAAVRQGSYALGRPDHRHGAWECAFHQSPRGQGQSLEERLARWTIAAWIGARWRDQMPVGAMLAEDAGHD